MARKSTDITTATRPATRTAPKGTVPPQDNGTVADGKVLTGKVLPVTTAEYQSAKSAFQSAHVQAEKAAPVLLAIVGAEAYDSYGFEDAPALFADMLGGLALPGKLTTGANLRIVAALVTQKYTSEVIANMIGAAGKTTLTYVRKAAIESGLLPDNGNGNGAGSAEKVNGGKAKVTDDGLIQVPSFKVTRDDAGKLAKYLAKMGVTLTIPELPESE